MKVYVSNNDRAALIKRSNTEKQYGTLSGTLTSKIMPYLHQPVGPRSVCVHLLPRDRSQLRDNFLDDDVRTSGHSNQFIFVVNTQGLKYAEMASIKDYYEGAHYQFSHKDCMVDL